MSDTPHNLAKAELSVSYSLTVGDLSGCEQSPPPYGYDTGGSTWEDQPSPSTLPAGAYWHT